MDERVIRFRVGVVVVAAAIITVILITLLGAWPNLFTPRYSVFIEFPRAPGVSVDTPVRKSGIRIGRVTRVDLQDDGSVLLKLQIERQYTLRRDEVCRISTGSLVSGDAVLEFVPGPRGASAEPIADDDFLTNGLVASDPFQLMVGLESEITSTLGSIAAAGNEVSQLARNVNSLLGEDDDRLARLVTQAERALAETERAMQNANKILGDEAFTADVKQLTADIQRTLGEAGKAFEETKSTMEGFNRVSVRAERNLANIERFTEPLGERGDEITESIARSVRNIDDLLDQLVQLTRTINSREGSVGKLIRNPEVYDKLNRAMSNIEEATRRIQPIADDLRVFSDKIARDPRILGAKGALDRRPSGAGNKLPLR